MEEFWKDIEGFDGKYKISNQGNVKSFYQKKERILKPNKNKINGYLKVTLNQKGISKTCYLHKLVAKHFIPNPNNYEEVNHKDENKENNFDTNLEWCTKKYNINYGNGKYKRAEYLRKKILQYDKEMKLIKEWDSLTEAMKKLNIHKNNISQCCKGQHKTAGGFIWRFKDE